MLEIKNISKSFGGVEASKDISFTVPQGKITSLIGPNGAGKTTLFAQITGFTMPDAGRVYFCGEEITGLAPEQIARKGMVRTFQIVQPFTGQTVCENIAVGAHQKIKSRDKALKYAEKIAKKVGLEKELTKEAQSLTVAGQKRLELARALATDPKLILLDEVLAGLNPTEIEEVIPLIEKIRAGGVTIFMIEHVMQAVMRLSEYGWVLNQGEIIAAGTPQDTVRNKDVVEAYLGKKMSQTMKNKKSQSS